MVTICITTHNRPKITCNLLRRLFYCDEVEFIVVDDGSTEENSQVIQKYISSNRLSVRYFYKENGGKLSALMYGLQYAKGKYFTDLDSDDEMSERHVLNILTSIREAESLRINGKYLVGVCGLSETTHGEVVGDRFPADLAIGSYFKMRLDHRLTGNKVEVILTEKLKAIDIKFFEGEKRMPTNVLWFSLLGNPILFVNKPFEIYFSNGSESITSNVRKLAIESRNSTRAEYKLIISNKRLFESPKSYLIALIRYLRFSFHGASPYIEKDLRIKERVLLICLSPISLLLCCRDVLLLQLGRFKKSELT